MGLILTQTCSQSIQIDLLSFIQQHESNFDKENLQFVFLDRSPDVLLKIISQKTVGYVIKLHVVSALHIIFIHCVSFCRLRFNKKNYSGNAGAEKNLTDFHNFAACVHSNFFNTVQNAQTFWGMIQIQRDSFSFKFWGKKSLYQD